jgi:hypothetical protein
LLTDVQEAPVEWVLKAFENDHAFVRIEELRNIRVRPYAFVDLALWQVVPSSFQVREES